MALELACKESGCPEKVSYERETIPALASSPQAREIVVYLTCPKGHQHRYKIEPGEGGSGGAASATP